MNEKKLFGKWNEIVLLLLGFTLKSIVGVYIAGEVQDRSYNNQHRQALM